MILNNAIFIVAYVCGGRSSTAEHSDVVLLIDWPIAILLYVLYKVYKSAADLKKSKSKKFFCSKLCQTIWRNSIVYIGSNHSNWKGGETTYRNILIRAKLPKICKRCKNNDERLLAVHHVDSNRKNNNLKNLTWLCYNCHHLIHRDIKERQKFMEILV